MPSMSAVEQAFCRSGAWRLATRRAILPWALQGLHLRGALLEMGAGSGAMAAGTADAFPDLQLTVTDIDPAMVNMATQRLREQPRISVQQADVTDLPFDDQSYDFVASYLMLHHVIDWNRAVREAARVLRPGGTFFGYDLTRTRLARWIHWADRSPYQLINADELRSAVEDVGLSAARVHEAFGGHVMLFRADKPMP